MGVCGIIQQGTLRASIDGRTCTANIEHSPDIRPCMGTVRRSPYKCGVQLMHSSPFGNVIDTSSSRHRTSRMSLISHIYIINTYVHIHTDTHICADSTLIYLELSFFIVSLQRLIFSYISSYFPVFYEFTKEGEERKKQCSPSVWASHFVRSSMFDELCSIVYGGP